MEQSYSYNKDHPCYRRWKGMKERCNNPNNKSYDYYGGRGITVCEEWDNSFKSFANWCDTNGYKKGLTLDRIDNNKGYSPSNCRFVSMSENCKNQRIRKNNKTGITGLNKHGNKYRLRLSYKGKRYDLGLYDTVKDASVAANKFERKNKTI